eukprot:5856995-Lingulodinium_polyedra.AAC.1
MGITAEATQASARSGRPTKLPGTGRPSAMKALQHTGNEKTKKAPFWSSPDQRRVCPSPSGMH